MHKLIIQLLLKYDFLEIIPIQESFFKISKLTKKVKLSSELIRLNYAKLSPIKNPTIISYKEDSTIYLWFLKQLKIDKKILIPESFLLYKTLRQKYQDGIFVFETIPKQIYVIKANKLESAFVSYENIEDLDIKIVKDEYNLTNIQIFDKKEYDNAIKIGLEKLTIKELLSFAQLNLDKENLKKFFVQKLTYPIISFLFVYMFVSYAQGYFMQKKVDILTQRYQELRSQTSSVKSAIRKHNFEVKKLEQLFKTEFEPVEPFKIVYDLDKVITPKDKAKVIFFSLTNDDIKIKIKTKDDAIKYLKRFNAIPYLSDVVIDNTFQYRNGYKIHTFTMKIKANNE